MANKTIARISLDIYNNNYIMVNAKQADIYSRFIEVTVTEKGKPLILDKEMTTVHVRCSKPDGTYVYSQNANITDDGKVMVELEQQMLAVYGQCYVDLTLLQYSLIDDTTVTTSKYTVSVLSTMGFYINVVEQPVHPTVVTSTNEFSILTENIAKNTILQKEIEMSLQTMSDLEENLRQIDVEACLDAALKADTAASNTDAVISNANAATLDANNAADRANIAAENCEGIVDGSGIIMKTEKGVANGVATLDSNIKIPNVQINTNFSSGNKNVIVSGEALNIILGKIAAYMNAFDNMPVVHTGTSDPSSSLGNNGDYYLKLLKE